MMLSTARRVCLPMARRQIPIAVSRAFASAVPDDGYDDEHHLKIEHLEYLDSQIEKTVSTLESNMSKLKETYAEKREKLSKMENDAKYEPDLMGMWPLLDKSQFQKQEMTENLSELKSLLSQVRSLRRGAFAVDAPDGESDGHLEEELLEVEHIMEDTGKERPKMKEFAVDGPDGASDWETKEQSQDLNDMVEEMSHTEDTARIERQHKMEKDVQKDRARDPEHDW